MVAIFIRCKAKGCPSRRDLVLGTEKCPVCEADLRRANAHSYRVVVWHKGRRYTNGKAPNLATAQKIELEYRQNAAINREPKQVKSMRLEDAWQLLLNKMKEPKFEEWKKTWACDERRWENYVSKSKLAAKKLEDIDQQDLLALINALEATKSRRGKPYAQATLKHVYALIRKTLIWCEANGYYHGIRPKLRFELDNEVDNPLMPEECSRLQEAAMTYAREGHDALMAGMAVVFLMLTGRRRGEVFGLKWSNVRPELNGVTYRKTKNGKDLRTPLSSQAWSVLQAMRQHQLEDCQLVWHQQNGKSFYHTFKAHWQRILKQAGLEDKKLRPHDLRHTFGSLLGAARIGGPAIQSLMGHGDLKSTERYLHMGQYPGQMTVVLEELAHVAGLHEMVEAPGDERSRADEKQQQSLSPQKRRPDPPKRHAGLRSGSRHPSFKRFSVHQPGRADLPEKPQSGKCLVVERSPSQGIEPEK